MSVHLMECGQGQAQAQRGLPCYTLHPNSSCLSEGSPAQHGCWQAGNKQASVLKHRTVVLGFLVCIGICQPARELQSLGTGPGAAMAGPPQPRHAIRAQLPHMLGDNERVRTSELHLLEHPAHAATQLLTGTWDGDEASPSWGHTTHRPSSSPQKGTCASRKSATTLAGAAWQAVASTVPAPLDTSQHVALRLPNRPSQTPQHTHTPALHRPHSQTWDAPCAVSSRSMSILGSG